MDPLVSVDFVSSVNTTIACIVLVLLFVIYKLSVNLEMWFLPPSSCLLISPIYRGLVWVELFSVPGLALVSPRFYFLFKLWEHNHEAFMLWVWVEFADPYDPLSESRWNNRLLRAPVVGRPSSWCCWREQNDVAKGVNSFSITRYCCGGFIPILKCFFVCF